LTVDAWIWWWNRHIVDDFGGEHQIGVEKTGEDQNEEENGSEAVHECEVPKLDGIF
jgi:hypothetical protein